MMAPERLSLLDAERLAVTLAGNPETRHLGDTITALAEPVVDRLTEHIVRQDAQIARGDTEAALSSYHSPDGAISLGTNYLDRCLLLTGIANAYGETHPAEPALLEYRNSDAVQRWDQFVRDHAPNRDDG